ncbi:nucleotidyltransferase domain-containing protein [Aurantimonas sp. MSK8Z-1]|uniref:nucleotidyltransferase family protein n=1 Tax=Mangrovibrevibacter kandeliae TaxID=2968473 RepID=UPI002117552F|nr:nucleotidyltransferase domain-containing protein [Aurantimonas sp. MSK8Z-1]MCW4113606.1 nucleotidyltransferase domain-containing protein [Aurantimonas sp. MSK8Z-1]
MDAPHKVPVAVTTLNERKAAEAARREAAAGRIVTNLHSAAARLGGRYVVFGSCVADAMRFDSDLDILLDFPPERTGEAWRIAEDAAASADLPVDLHDARTSRPSFVARVVATGLVLS